MKIKSIYIFCFTLIFSFPLITYLNAQNYTLVWSDEFFGTTINPNNWTHDIGGWGWGNNELQYYTSRADNSYLEDGKLVIEAKEESYGGRNYTSARLKTEGKQFFKYGRIEARIKLPYGQGIWPAFWMLGENISSIGWPACGEIDIMELVGGTNGDNVSHGTLHWDSNGHAQYGTNYILSNGIFADDYHVFAIEWTPTAIEWYVDGNLFLVIDITPADLSEFHENFFIILNMAVGGNWPGSPDGSTVFPQKMYIDYVRVYKNSNAIPDITILNPADGSVFAPNENISLAADVEFQGDIQSVDFYQGAQRIGTTNLEPYSITWSSVSQGCYEITAKAKTNEGYEGLSESVSIQVGDSCVEAPYSGNPVLIPGSIEVENFNIGGPNISFYDTDVVNQGAAYRLTDQVDIENCLDENGGFNIGYTVNGEWMKYVINVEVSGDYLISGRVASDNSGGAFRVEFNGENKTGTLSVPNTGGWQQWSNISTGNVFLESGIYIVRVYIESSGFNLNKIDIYPSDVSPKLNLLFPSGGESIGVGTIQEIKWRSILVKDVSIGLTIDNGQTWNFITQKTTSEFGVYRWLVPESPSSECLIMILDKSNSSNRDSSENTFTIENVNNINNRNFPFQLKLEQNYPNPFNPATSIKYSIPKQCNVSLKVFDLLGSELVALVNKEQPQGNYEVELDGSNFTSGIYFYRLQTGDFVQTRKMILMK